MKIELTKEQVKIMQDFMTEEQVKIIQDSMTEEQIKTIRDALATKMDSLRDKICLLYELDDLLVATLAIKMDSLRDELCILYELDDTLVDALHGEEEAEDRTVDEGEAFYNKDLRRDSNDDSEEV